MDHLKSVPHRQSHYEQGKSNRLYFSNPDLTIIDLHEAFKKFFNEKTGTVMEMKYKTFQILSADKLYLQQTQN